MTVYEEEGRQAYEDGEIGVGGCRYDFGTMKRKEWEKGWFAVFLKKNGLGGAGVRAATEAEVEAVAAGVRDGMEVLVGAEVVGVG